MATFVIIPTTGNTGINNTIPTRFGNASFQLPQGQWLVAYDGTSKQLSDELGISDCAEGGAVVLSFSGFWGRASNDVWEWIQMHGDH